MDDNLRFKWFARVPGKVGKTGGKHTAPNQKNKTNSIKRRVLLLFA